MEGLPTAMMDLSDGLTSDLPRLCAASNVGAVIDPTALPHHPELGNKTDSIALKVGAGDDYQLLFSAQKADAKSIHRIAAQHHTSIQCIGHMTKEPAVRLLGHPWPAPAYSHFDEAAQ